MLYELGNDYFDGGDRKNENMKFISIHPYDYHIYFQHHTLNTIRRYTLKTIASSTN